MIRLLTLIGLTLLLFARANAQSPVEVFYEKDNTGAYAFYSRNTAFCPYTITITFTELNGMRSSATLPYQTEVRPGQQSLFKLQPQSNQPSSFRYTFNFIKGCKRPKADTTMAYLLPASPGKRVIVSELAYIGKLYAGQAEPKDWYSLAIKMNSGDTVFAARRGMVSAVVRDAAPIGTHLSFHRDDNKVEINHADCSFATYTVFRPKSIFVEPGQFVEAGTPLGIVGGENYDFGPHVRFAVHYNYEAPVIKNGQPTDQKQYWAYIPVRFWLKDEQKAGRLEPRKPYLSEHPESIIEQEMSKREVKKWQKSHVK
ncbi:M23 family metallopeptidase [Spirosoma endbachense]|uniref:Peptidoglycan DD-metalloendopeptidase family protein n=1 Tax=Spirosoma endbachense TaxID=2666025 RepID=A0A6P1VZN9_9BACT|nr:M23 family metallopeptidase [Spirosoma endbachense]QHV98255.1 peptidoglycan DD-metalloendopeptidase family protein [Spirosoma endbachense]